MRRDAVAVIDVGKTHTKLHMVSPEGEVLATASVASRSADGALDAEAAWSWALAELARLAQGFTPTALVPTTHGAAAAIVGGDELLLPIGDYEAMPPAAIDDAYDAIRPPFAETYSPRLPAGLNLGRQLYAASRGNPHTWRKATAVLAYPQYWSWRLTGVAAAEVTSLGCHTDLWNPLSAAPSSLVTREGWSRLLPPLTPAWHTLGQPRRALGLPFDCDVLSGIHDSNAAYLRYLAGVTTPFALLSTGTWMICFNSGGALRALDPARDTLANVDVLARPIACSRFMGGREYAAIAGPEGLALAPTIDDAKAVLARRTFALPSFTASGGPYPRRRGRLTAEPASALEAAALAAVYVALMSRDSMLLTGPVQRLYVDGPFAANDAYTGCLAALLPDVEVHAATDSDGTAIGAALLARMHAGDARVPQLPVPTRRIVAPPLQMASYADEWRERVEKDARAVA